MIYLTRATLRNSKGDTITSDIVSSQESIDTNTLNDYQMRRALEYKGITPKQKTKYDSWKDAKVIRLDIIKEIRGIL